MFGEFLKKVAGFVGPKISGEGGAALAKSAKAAGSSVAKLWNNKRFLYTAGGFTAAGLGASIGTGNWGYLPVGIGAGLAGGISGGLGKGPFKRIVGASALGMGAGLAGVGPMGVPIAVGATLATPWALKGYGKGVTQIPKVFKSYGRLVRGRPFDAAKTLGRMKNPYWATFALGTGIGLGWGGLKTAIHSGNATAGYFPGGINYMPPGRGGMASDPMNTAGLTLALHRHNRSSNRVM